MSTEIVRGAGSRVMASDGREYIDLMSGFGAVFLGHCRADIADALKRQADSLWACARFEHPASAQARSAIEAILPTGYHFGGLYSTGMEVAEFAMRVAARHTGRREFVGFASSMHGKSVATAALAWANAPVGSTQMHLLPFVSTATEDQIVEQLTGLLAGGRIAALFVEPIQGSNGGHEGSAAFYERLIEACHAHGTLCIFDEILTGLYRTGPCFHSDSLQARPDVVLFAKSMGNGFPVSGIALREPLGVAADALPGSTFSGNPLAAATVAATLGAMGALDMTTLVTGIDRTVRQRFASRTDLFTLRGRGALWVLEASPRVDMPKALEGIRVQGVLASSHGRCIRLLPAATIGLDDLDRACGAIEQAAEAAIVKAA
ncbi:aminotransferase class III-fold pyridoxal phosphate-dependent enzyme [Piscinibacter terrae]|uniref:Aminotransferase class III-fold pyridoxal phosphate-dependent enzyme n=1 Tax=Piscinibacter terrae TaxID=2496871 RepID=A0A3N7HJ71_9BURK|nr:aminotransferase class III-fold pyridoxal phosphate-dependent enzyme [Albitalea terrae]RQP22100.1 aminotransferase class III-fold pyridoxal phosphate-dependent enzyme [Albitalea terrae]